MERTRYRNTSTLQPTLILTTALVSAAVDVHWAPCWRGRPGRLTKAAVSRANFFRNNTGRKHREDSLPPAPQSRSHNNHNNSNNSVLPFRRIVGNSSAVTDPHSQPLCPGMRHKREHTQGQGYGAQPHKLTKNTHSAHMNPLPTPRDACTLATQNNLQTTLLMTAAQPVATYPNLPPALPTR